VQDFTQLQLQGTFYQGFIIVFQEFDQEEASKLKTRMHHFVAPRLLKTTLVPAARSGFSESPPLRGQSLLIRHMRGEGEEKR